MKILLYNNDLPNDIEITGSVAIDTETMGLSPYRDRLCLVQLKFEGNDICYLIQFHNNFTNAENLKKILQNDKIAKIFHYARFDMAVIYKYLGVMTKNVYCTKIASKLTRTYANSHSLLNLCEELLGVMISKKETCTDWGAANLTEEQKIYAATDVIYLHDLKAKLDTFLERESRKDLAQQCFNFLQTRVKLDLMVNEFYDIFSHS